MKPEPEEEYEDEDPSPLDEKIENSDMIYEEPDWFKTRAIQVSDSARFGNAKPAVYIDPNIGMPLNPDTTLPTIRLPTMTSSAPA